MLFREKIAIYIKIRKKNIKTLCGKMKIFLMLQYMVRSVTAGF